jgi:fatty acid desaturase
MPTTHDGHRRSHPIGLDIFALVLVAIVVGTVLSVIGQGWPGYVPALITAAAVLLTWLVLSHRGTHRAHRRPHRGSLP